MEPAFTRVVVDCDIDDLLPDVFGADAPPPANDGPARDARDARDAQDARDTRDAPSTLAREPTVAPQARDSAAAREPRRTTDDVVTRITRVAPDPGAPIARLSAARGKGVSDLRGVKLPGAELSGGDFTGAVLGKADLHGAGLTRAGLSAVDLAGADLHGADLTGADLSGADLTGADLRDAALVGANMRGAILTEADLTGAELLGADLTDADLSKCRAVRAGLGNVTLDGVHAFGADLSDASLSGASVKRADLRSTNLTRARMRDCDLTDADLERADMHETDLRGSTVTRTRFVRVDLAGAHLQALRDGARATWIEAKVAEVDFCGAYLLRRAIMDENYLHEFRQQGPWHRAVYWMWWATSDCGRSALRWGVLTCAFALLFAVGFGFVTVDYGRYETGLSPLYYSIVTLTTLGYGDVLPASTAAQILALIEVTVGYVMLGGLLSIFSTKMGRRAG